MNNTQTIKLSNTLTVHSSKAQTSLFQPFNLASHAPGSDDSRIPPSSMKNDHIMKIRNSGAISMPARV